MQFLRNLRVNYIYYTPFPLTPVIKIEKLVESLYIINKVIIVVEEDIHKGYRGAAKKKLKEFGVKVWSDVILKSTRGTFNGIILPRAET